MTDQRPVMLSGIQPSGHLTLGNYLGAIARFVLEAWVEGRIPDFG